MLLKTEKKREREKKDFRCPIDALDALSIGYHKNAKNKIIYRSAKNSVVIILNFEFRRKFIFGDNAAESSVGPKLSLFQK